MNGFGTALVGALLLGGLSTAYDAVWAAWIPRHRAIYGLVHGMTLLSAVGLVLGWPARRPWIGLMGGALAGLAAAAAFYALAPWLGMSAMFPAWMLLWLLFAALDAYLHRRSIVAAETLSRGVLAAVLSGAAFWSISGIWLGGHAGGPSYAWNFVRWVFAYLPGFAALVLRPRTAVYDVGRRR
jgi:hypothetical protein